MLEDTEPGPLLELATALALADERVMISVLDVKVVPTQTPLEVAEKWLAQRQGTREYALSQMVAQAAAKGVPVRMLHRAAHGLDSGGWR